MPQTKLIYFKDASGAVPVLEWLSRLRRRDKKVYAKCVVAIELLHQLGHELRRPIADYLRDGVYELRPKSGRVNYRILYFFRGKASTCRDRTSDQTKATVRQESSRLHV